MSLVCRSCRFFHVARPLCATTGCCCSSTRSSSHLSWRSVSSRFPCCRLHVVDVAQDMQVPGHLHPCRSAEACSHGPDCLSDQEIPQLLDTVVDVPVVLVVQDQGPQGHGLPELGARRLVAWTDTSSRHTVSATAATTTTTWCRHLESLPDVRPQLYADNLKCSTQCLHALFGAAKFTARYVRAVGQDVSPGKCVHLSTSKSVRKALKLWDISGDGSFWKVQLDVRDLGGHLDFTDATAGVACLAPGV